VGHRLGLATRTQISVCKSPFPSAGTAVSPFRAKPVQQRPLLPREVDTRLPDCGVTHNVRHSGTELSTLKNPVYASIQLGCILSHPVQSRFPRAHNSREQVRNTSNGI